MNQDTTESRISRTSAATGTRTRAQTVTRYTSTRTGVVGGGKFRLRRVWRRTSRRVRRSAVFLRDTVTAAGLLLITVLVVGLVVGLSVAWLEALVVAAIAGALLVLSIPFLFAGQHYGVRLMLDRDRVVAGSTVTGHLDIVNRGKRIALPGIVDVPVGQGLVEAHVPLLRPGADHREPLEISAERRGIIDVGPMTIARGDPVGILRREVAWPETRKIFVHPVTVPIPSTGAGQVRDLEGLPTNDIVDADLSFHAIREYAPGDSQRHIHWKSTAKTGTLMVRQYEESRHARIAVLLDLRREEFASEDEFEMAVSGASSLAVQGIRDGRDVLMIASSAISEVVQGTVESIRTLPTVSGKALLDAVCDIRAADESTRIESVAALTAQTFPEISIVFFVTGSRVPLLRLRQAAIAFPSQVTTIAVRCEPAAEPTLRQTQELGVMTIGELHDLKYMIARGAVR